MSIKEAQNYKKRVEQKGGICELVIYPDAKHAAFYQGKYFEDSKQAINKFLDENLSI